MRPSISHAPGLDVATDAMIKKILRQWRNGEAQREKPKKRK